MIATEIYKETTKVGKDCQNDVDYSLLPARILDVGSRRMPMQAMYTIVDVIDDLGHTMRANGPALNSLDISIMSIIYSEMLCWDRERAQAQAAGRPLKDPKISIHQLMLALNPKIKKQKRNSEALRQAVIASIQKLIGRRIRLDYTDQARAMIHNPKDAKKIKSMTIDAPFLAGQLITVDTGGSTPYDAVQILPVDGRLCDSLALYKYAASIGQIGRIPAPLRLTADAGQNFSLPKQALKTIMSDHILSEIRQLSRNAKDPRVHQRITLDWLLARFEADQRRKVKNLDRWRKYADEYMQLWLQAGLLTQYDYNPAEKCWHYTISPATYRDNI